VHLILHRADRLRLQVESLKGASEEEAARFAAEVEALKEQVAAALDEFSEGVLAAEALLERLHGLGVRVTFAASELPAIQSADVAAADARCV
jgi:Zn-dependent peptidase ImmA (M78 family)